MCIYTVVEQQGNMQIAQRRKLVCRVLRTCRGAPAPYSVSYFYRLGDNHLVKVVLGSFLLLLWLLFLSQLARFLDCIYIFLLYPLDQPSVDLFSDMKCCVAVYQKREKPPAPRERERDKRKSTSRLRFPNPCLCACARNAIKRPIQTPRCIHLPDSVSIENRSGAVVATASRQIYILYGEEDGLRNGQHSCLLYRERQGNYKFLVGSLELAV